MNYLSRSLIAAMVVATSLVGCQRKDQPEQSTKSKAHKLISAPSQAPKTVLVRVPADGNMQNAQYVEIDQEVQTIESALKNNSLAWRSVNPNQVINQQNGYPQANQLANNQRYFIQDPSNYQPNAQQPSGQNPYNQSSPYSMGNYYTQNMMNNQGYGAPQQGGYQGNGMPQQGNYQGYGMPQGNMQGMQGYYYWGGIYAPYWGWGNGGYGYAYGYNYGYYNYPNYYGCGYGYGCGAYNHYYPYYYYSYANYYYQPCYYWNTSYWYYYNAAYLPAYYGYNYYMYAGWWY